MHKIKKTFFVLGCFILISIIVVILFISPISKYLIQKYDKKYIGREITIDWAYVNPFTGYIHLDDLKIYEQNSDSVFFSANGLSINIEMLKLFSKTYEISQCTLDHPKGIIIQNKKDLNFDDLIEKFSRKGDSHETKSPVKFNIFDIKISDGEFYYHEREIPIDYFIKNVHIESAGKNWDADTIAARLYFLSGMGSGSIKGNCTINLENLNYAYSAVINKYDLNIIQQYLKDLTNYGTFSANLDADVKATGSFKDKQDVTIKGMFAINDFHFGKNPKEDYASFDKMTVVTNELSPKNLKYIFDSISLAHPYVKYELYDHLDNLQTIFGKSGSNVKNVNANPSKFNLIIEIAHYINEISKNFFKSNYKINRLAIYNGDFKFNDFSESEKFSAALNPLYFIADSVNKNHDRVNASLKSGIKPYGNISTRLSINPKDEQDFDLQYHLGNLSTAMFNPYIISFTSFPIDRGTMEFNGNWNVKNGIIESDNHVVVIDPRVTKRIKNKDLKWIPMPLILALIRERGNVIDYQIPITGNLKNPKFHLKDVFLDLLVNIFVKPVTTPYRVKVRNVETEIEKSLTLRWKMRSNSLESNQEKFIQKMADFLVENPKATITVYPQNYAIKEKEYILFFEAKKKYFLTVNHKKSDSFCKADSETVNKLSIKDSLFIHYLNKEVKNPLMFTVQDKCTELVGSNLVNARFQQLKKNRIKVFMFYFAKNAVEKQVKIKEDNNIIPYNGFSFYKINYKGEPPEPLQKAIQEMNELNDEPPRKEFKETRKGNKNII